MSSKASPQQVLELSSVERSARTSLEPKFCAERANLVYVNDDEPGIRRRRHGRGYCYRDAAGCPVSDRQTLARIRSLAIPPAWTDVWIAHDPAAHIQATGRDQKRRKQYRYHPEWTSFRDQAKFSSLVEFAHRLPRQKVLATVVSLLDMTFIRVGNDAYARENRSFGLTTLTRRHLDLAGTQLRFSFRGKSGQEWKLKISDRRVASVIRNLQELPGQRLFKYLDEHGETRQVHSQDVNDYIHEVIGPDFTSKHFRTWGATTKAAIALAMIPVPDTRREQTRHLNACIDDVANQLRNTRAVCRRCYIHPAVTEAWLDGSLGADLATLRARFPRPLSGLNHEESTVLRWLRQRQDRTEG